MMNEHWVATAITSDVLVAELLLRLKQSSSSNSSPPPTIATATTTTTTTSLNPLGWGDRKSRTKPSTISTVAGINGFGKGHQQRSPSTPLSWSDGYDEYSRPSDLSSGDRSTKVEGSTTSMEDKSRKRKIDSLQNPKNKDGRFVQVLHKIESEIKIEETRFVLPDLNETPGFETIG